MRGLIKEGATRVSYESALSREARCKADKANQQRKKNKKTSGNQGKGNGIKSNPNAPRGQLIGNSGKRLWTKDRFLSGEKTLNKTQRAAARRENARTGYNLPNYASGCVLDHCDSHLRGLPMADFRFYAPKCVLPFWRPYYLFVKAIVLG